MSHDNLPPVSSGRSRPPISSAPRLALLAVLAGAIFFGLRSYFREAPTPDDSHTQPPVIGMAVTDPHAIAPPPIDLVKRQLPNGMTISAASNSTELSLLAFVADPGRPASRDLWFPLNKVTFEDGSQTPTQDSALQLENLAAILAGWPLVAIELRPVAMSADDRAAQNLAQRQVETVRATLLGYGIAENRIRVAPANDPIPPANTPELGRISIAVVEK